MRRRKCSSTLARRLIATTLKRQLETIQRKETLEYSAPDARGAAFGRPTFFAPVSLAEFARLRADHPDARILAGSTDVGLWVTKQFRNLGDILYIGNVTELKSITRDGAMADHRRGGLAGRCVRRALGRLSGTRRIVDALCVAADPQRRHARRQRGERLAHRRFHAGADRPRCRNRAAKSR